MLQSSELPDEISKHSIVRKRSLGSENMDGLKKSYQVMLTKCEGWEPLITILGKESEGPQEFQIVKIFFSPISKDQS